MASPRALLLVFAAVGSVQFGAALARTLFDDAGPAGTVFLRVVFAAIALAVLWRPPVRGHSRDDWRLIVGFGLSLAAMNLCFYEAIDRIPLGLAVTFEFVGPLGVAVAGSRRPIDLFWVACAAAGILLISAPGTSGLDPLGIVFAMCVAAVLLIPFGIPVGGDALLDPTVIALGAAVAMLSSAIPYSAEFEALRLLPEHVFGVLLSLEPAVASLAGFLVLDQDLGARQLAGIALGTVAVAGAVASTRAPAPRDG